MMHVHGWWKPALTGMILAILAYMIGWFMDTFERKMKW